MDTESTVLLTFFTTTIVLSVCAAIPVMANPDPLNVVWLVTDSDGTPLDGAQVEIYWSTSPDTGFTPMDSTIVEDVIAEPNVFRNPIVSGYWNPVHNSGIAWADLHIQGVSNYYFYAKITEGTNEWYWPVATSIKPKDNPSDPDWYPVRASGSPSGYAASGNGFGNGVTTAYPSSPPLIPPEEIPEFSTIALPALSLVGLFAFFSYRKKIKSN